MAWGDDAKRFLSRVLPWPASANDAGFGNLHWTVINDTPKGPRAPKVFWNGQAFKSATDAWAHIQWLRANRSKTRDMYFCTSLQAQTTKTKTGFEIALRDQANTLGSKVLFLDIDVKAPPKGYSDIKEAWAELKRFVTHYNFPMPTALVASGSGMHCYWISNKIFSPAEWQPLAEGLRAAAVSAGLRFDAGVTIDIVRILRVPETQNFKTDPPGYVKLIHLADQDLDFDQGFAAALLAVPRLTPATSGCAPAPTTSAIFDPKLFAKRPVPQQFAGAVGEAAKGLEPEAPPLDTKAIFQGCRFLGQALATGGQYHDQPLWNLAVLASTFLPNGRKVAHAISDKHAGYDPQSTDELYDRKEREKKSHNLGWPSCAAIEQNGSKECAGCPLRGAIRSPLNAGTGKKPLPPGVATFSPITAASKFTQAELRPGYPRWDKYMPEGYAFDEQGYVCAVLAVKEKTAEGTDSIDVLVPLLIRQQILNPMLQETGTSQVLRFEIDGNLGELRQVFVSRSSFGRPQDMMGRLHEQGVAPSMSMLPQLGVFFVELARKLEELKKSRQHKPLGWVSDKTGFTGFAYGGKTFYPDGTEGPAGFLDANTATSFTPIGTDLAFRNAATFILSQKRPDQDVFLTVPFGAPFMQFTSHNLGLINYWGTSGGGKSTCLKFGMAVWGHPETGRVHKDGTVNAVPHKMGILSNLPLMWDEIADEKSMESQATVMMMDGSEKARMGAGNAVGLHMRASGTWSTLMGSTSNYSFFEYAASKIKDTNAGPYRVFEFEVSEKTIKVSSAHVDAFLQDLRFNYGAVGLDYAKRLAMLLPNLKAIVKAEAERFIAIVGADEKERFWVCSCVCMLLGAKYAKEYGYVDFDLDVIEDFLVKAFLDLRARLIVEGSEGADAAIEILSAFIKDHFQQILVTDRCPEGRGAYHQPIINIYKQPQLTNTRGIHIQWIDRPVDPVLRISRRELHKWLDAAQHRHSVIYTRIAHKITEKVRLGGGTNYSSAPERVMEIAIEPGSWIQQLMSDITGRVPASGCTSTSPPSPPAGAPTTEQGILAAAAVARQKDQESTI